MFSRQNTGDMAPADACVTRLFRFLSVPRIYSRLFVMSPVRLSAHLLGLGVLHLVARLSITVRFWRSIPNYAGRAGSASHSPDQSMILKLRG